MYQENILNPMVLKVSVLLNIVTLTFILIYFYSKQSMWTTTKKPGFTNIRKKKTGRDLCLNLSSRTGHSLL